MDHKELTIEIRLFAGAAELAGCRSITARVPEGARLPQVIDQLLGENPKLERLAELSRWAVGTDFVSPEFEFHDSTSLAMIPPVSGG